MKRLVWVLAVLVLFSCKRGEESEQPEENLVVESNITEEQKDFATEFKTFLEAFKNDDYASLNKFIQPNERVYTIFPTEGMYSEFLDYDDMETLIKDRNTVDAIAYFKQSTQDARVAEGEIMYEDLSEVDPCDIKEIGYYGDYGKTTILSETYRASIENLGEEVDMEEFKNIKACEENVKIKVMVGIGEEADVFYFTEDGGNWYITIMDFSECGG